MLDYDDTDNIYYHHVWQFVAWVDWLHVPGVFLQSSSLGEHNKSPEECKLLCESQLNEVRPCLAFNYLIDRGNCQLLAVTPMTLGSFLTDSLKDLYFMGCHEDESGKSGQSTFTWLTYRGLVLPYYAIELG